jgi:YD repeat-containing protein
MLTPKMQLPKEVFVRHLRIFALLAASLLPSASYATTQMSGSVDGFTINSSGNPILGGWACVIGSPNSINVSVYLGQAAPAGQYVGTFTANQPSEPGVATACQSTGTNYRFDINMAGSTAGLAVFVYAISPTDGSTVLIPPSGSIYVPPPASSGGDAITYDYDGSGRVNGISYANGTRIIYSYDTSGNRNSVLTHCPGTTC